MYIEYVLYRGTLVGGWLGSGWRLVGNPPLTGEGWAILEVFNQFDLADLLFHSSRQQ